MLLKQYITEQNGSRLKEVTLSEGGRTLLAFCFENHDTLEMAVGLDGAVLGVLPYAMYYGKDIELKGGLSSLTLHNLAEFQSVLASFYPRKFRPVKIHPGEILDLDAVGSRSRSRPISLFSGGVDATFTLLRHQDGQGNIGAITVKNVLHLHHVALNNQRDYVQRRLERFTPLFESLGVTPWVQKTNLRNQLKAARISYLPSHAMQLAASLHQYSEQFQLGFIGSTEPARSPVIPYGSSPATDWLLTSPDMTIHHDGAGYSRTEKVAFLAEDPIARRTLHVCLKHPYENCGKCNKCVRTQLNFLAVGIDRVECMPDALDLELIDRLELAPHDIAELKLISEFAYINGSKGVWLNQLRRRIVSESEESFTTARLDWVDRWVRTKVRRIRRRIL